MASRHSDDQELCRQQPGVCYGKVCDACEGRCPVCDSRSNPTKPVRICDSCAGAERFAVFENMDYAQLTEQQEMLVRQQKQLVSRAATSMDGAEENTATSSNTNNSNNSAMMASSDKRAGAHLIQGMARCMICSGTHAKHQAFYCRACVLLEKDRDGCPRAKGSSQRQQTSRLMAKQKSQFQRAAGGLFQ